jgi:hypothetical protein
MKITTVGIDLAKSVFQIHGVGCTAESRSAILFGSALRAARGRLASRDSLAPH